jgi:hypothetical protein
VAVVDTDRVTKTPAFAVLRFDDYLTDTTSDRHQLIKVVKVLLDIDVAREEADRLNGLKAGRSRYWVQTTHLETSQ